MKQRKPLVSILIYVTFLLPVSVSAGYGNPFASAQTPSASFPETGYTIQGIFLDYWNEHGGLAQFGYPISGELVEVSQQDNGIYTVQYFERAVFERHPENAGTPYEVLLSLLGAQHYLEYYGPDGASNQRPNLTNPIAFPETGHSIGGPFRAYWEQHGGLAQQGYPISDEFEETSAHDGKTYTVQYFERAVFELHPENKGTPYEVLLTQLGTNKHRERYGKLVIPDISIPDIPGVRLTRQSLKASDSYVVWSEVKVEPADFAPKRTPIGIYALDLRTNDVITVAPVGGYKPGFFPLISGSTIIWQPESGKAGQRCPNAILARDLRIGATYTIADGPAYRCDPSIRGKNVAWTEGDETPQHILIRDLHTNTTSAPIANVHPEDVSLWSPLVGDQYLVWLEIHSVKGAPSFYKIQSYNFKTGQTFTITQLVPSSPQLHDLSGRHLVWSSDSMSDQTTYLTDLSSGQTMPLTARRNDQIASLAIIRGNTVIWRAGAPGDKHDPVIWGMKLSDRTPVPLVFPSQIPWHIAIAGDWLVWSEGNDVKTMALTKAFERGHANYNP